jgi:hypothetical protein
MILVNPDRRNTCNREKNTNRLDIFLALNNATGMLMQKSTNEVSMTLPKRAPRRLTILATPINPAGNRDASPINMFIEKAISADEPITLANVIKLRLLKIFFIHINPLILLSKKPSP